MDKQMFLNAKAIEIKKIQARLLFEFFKSMMYKVYKEEWKDEIVKKINRKIELRKKNKNVYLGCYGGLIHSIRTKQDFREKDLDVTTTSALIINDFLDECDIDKHYTIKTIVEAIRIDRNHLSHSDQKPITKVMCSNAVIHLDNDLIAFLEAHQWIDIYKETICKNPKIADKFLKNIKNQLTDILFTIDPNLAKFSNGKEVIINFYYGTEIISNGHFNCSIKKFENNTSINLFKSDIQSGSSIRLPISTCSITCNAAPLGYDKFDDIRIEIKASSDEPIYINIDVSNQDKELIESPVKISILDGKNPVPGYDITIISKDGTYYDSIEKMDGRKLLSLMTGNYIVQCDSSPEEYCEFSDFDFTVDNDRVINDFCIYVRKKEDLATEFIKKRVVKSNKENKCVKVFSLFVVDKNKLPMKGFNIEVYNLDRKLKKPFKIWHTEGEPIKLKLYNAKYLFKIQNTDFTYYLNLSDNYEREVYWAVDLSSMNEKSFVVETEVYEDINCKELRTVKGTFNTVKESAGVDKSNSRPSEFDARVGYVKDHALLGDSHEEEIVADKEVNVTNDIGEVQEDRNSKEVNIVKDLQKEISIVGMSNTGVTRGEEKDNIVNNFAGLKETNKHSDVNTSNCNKINNKYNKPTYGYIVSGIYNKNRTFSIVDDCQPILSSTFDYSKKTHLNVYLKDLDGNNVYGCNVSVYNYDLLGIGEEVCTWIHNDDCHVLELSPGTYVIKVTQISDVYYTPTDRVVDIHDVNVNVTIELVLKKLKRTIVDYNESNHTSYLKMEDDRLTKFKSDEFLDNEVKNLDYESTEYTETKYIECAFRYYKARNKKNSDLTIKHSKNNFSLSQPFDVCNSFLYNELDEHTNLVTLRNRNLVCFIEFINNRDKHRIKKRSNRNFQIPKHNLDILAIEDFIVCDGKNQNDDGNSSVKSLKNFYENPHKEENFASINSEAHDQGDENCESVEVIFNGKQENFLDILRMGDNYFYGNGTNDNINKAFELYDRSVDLFLKSNHKVHDRENYLGELFYLRSRSMYEVRDISKGIRFTKLSAKAGYSKGWFDLGYLYERGEFLGKDLNTALSCYIMAMDGEYPDAYFAVANFYMFGYLGSKDYEKALYYCKLAAEHGCSNAIKELPKYREFYINSIQESSDLLLSTIRRGIIDEIIALGDKYYNGTQGFQLSYDKAYRCFYAAAVRDNAYSQYMLGKCYEKGLGVEMNIFKAKEWYRKAKEGGENLAIIALKELKERRY